MMAGGGIATASEFGPVNAGLASPPRKGIRNLDQQSQQNLDQCRRQLRSNPPKPATIINLHPWPLYYTNGDYYVRGITVPACEPGMDFSYAYVRLSKTERDMNEDGTLKFKPVSPIQIAGQFYKDFGESEIYGGGVIIFEGEHNPTKLLAAQTEVETYQPDGRADVRLVAGYVIDEEGHKIPENIEEPVKAKLTVLLETARRKRNERYMLKVQWADAHYKSTKAGDRALVTDQHRMMAEVLHAEGILPEVPDWNLASKMELGLAEDRCKHCGSNPAKDAFLCPNGHVLDPLKAYLNAAIEYGHMSMELLSAEQWVLADAEKERREKVKAAREKKTKKAKDE